MRASLRHVRKNRTGTRGIATSLLEATATIAVGAALSAAAVGVIADRVTESRIAVARNDVKSIAEVIGQFFTENTFFPFFITTDTHRNGMVVDVLKSRNGHEAEVPPSPSQESLWTASSFDFLENQLIDNKPGSGVFFGFGGDQGYPVRGELAFDLKRGWNGPYLANPPATDPWGNKFYVNVKFFQPDELDDRRVVMVLCAGPNETIQTPFTQTIRNPADKIEPGGDDIAERLR